LRERSRDIIGAVVAGEANGDGEVGFRARAGALTLFYICSPLDRETLLALLAETTTGARLIEEKLELPSEKVQIDSVFADRYLLEPSDPDLDPDEVDEHTLMRPTPAGREIPFVADALQRWLRRCPSGPIRLDDAAVDHARLDRPEAMDLVSRPSRSSQRSCPTAAWGDNI